MQSLSEKYKSKKAFSLLETIISIGIFVIFASAIYTSIQYIYKVVYSSRIQIIETAVLNEQVEIIRNMKFADVGVVSSTPEGVLSRNVVVTRNGIDFLVTRSVRNIDDPSDGTIDTGTDIHPNDYKLVFLEVTCANCQQAVPLSISTYLGDSFPENTANSGALFVNVKDSNNNPVKSANVHLTGNNKIVDDTTDNYGLLRIPDLPACYKCYKITVDKVGLTDDQTSSSTDFGGATPVNEYATVNDQQLTNVYFQIDTPSNILVKTLNTACVPVPSISLNVTGGAIVANNPDVSSFSVNDVSTDGSGEHNFNDLHWGNYNFVVNGGTYNLVGSSPSLPFNILANSSQTISLVVATSTGSSLSMIVRDSAQDTISEAKVTLNLGEPSEVVKYTGLGYVKQNSWPGPPYTYEFYNDHYGFWGSDNNVEYDTTNNPYGVKLVSIGNNVYQTSGWLESATFDFGSTDVEYVKLDWIPHVQHELTGVNPVYFQIATSNSSTPDSWDYLGPGDDPNTYYTLTSQDISSSNNGKRYLRYKMYLHTDNAEYTPSVFEVDILYVQSCSLPGQVYFDNISSPTGNTITIDALGYQTKSITNVTIDNNITTTTYLTSSS